MTFDVDTTPAGAPWYIRIQDDKEVFLFTMHPVRARGRVLLFSSLFLLCFLPYIVYKKCMCTCTVVLPSLPCWIVPCCAPFRVIPRFTARTTARRRENHGRFPFRPSAVRKTAQPENLRLSVPFYWGNGTEGSARNAKWQGGQGQDETARGTTGSAA